MRKTNHCARYGTHESMYLRATPPAHSRSLFSISITRVFFIEYERDREREKKRKSERKKERESERKIMNLYERDLFRLDSSQRDPS